MKNKIKRGKIIWGCIIFIIFTLIMLFSVKFLKYIYIRSFISEIKAQYETGYKEYEKLLQGNKVLSYEDVLSKELLMSKEEVETSKNNEKIRDKYYFLEESIDIYSDFKSSNDEVFLKLKVFPLNIEIKSLNNVKMQLRCREMVYVLNGNNYKAYNLEDVLLDVELLKNNTIWKPITFCVGTNFGVPVK